MITDKDLKCRYSNLSEYSVQYCRLTVVVVIHAVINREILAWIERLTPKIYQMI